MKTKWMTILVLTFSTALLLTAARPSMAAETEEEDFWREAGADRGHRRWQFTDENIERIMNRLKETDPEKATELEALRTKDLEQFKTELRNTLRTHFSRRRDHSRERYAEFLAWLKDNYPAETEKLAELKDKDPNDSELYRRRLRFISRRYRRIFEASKENPELAAVLKQDMRLREQRRELLRQIKAATDEKQKKGLMGALELLVSERFDLLVKKKEIEYEGLLKKLAKLQEEIEQSKVRVAKWKDLGFKNQNVKARIEKLLSRKTEFRW